MVRLRHSRPPPAGDGHDGQDDGARIQLRPVHDDHAADHRLAMTVEPPGAGLVEVAHGHDPQPDDQHNAQKLRPAAPGLREVRQQVGERSEQGGRGRGDQVAPDGDS